MEFFEILRQKNKEDLRKFITVQIGDKFKSPEWMEMLKDIKPLINVGTGKTPSNENLKELYKKHQKNGMIDYFLFFFTQQFEHEYMVIPSEKADYFENMYKVFKSSFDYNKIRPQFFAMLGQKEIDNQTTRIKKRKKVKFNHDFLREKIKNSTLCDLIKNHIIEVISNSSEQEIIKKGVLCLTKVLVEFLHYENFDVDDKSENEKFDNYLRQYFSQNLKNFPLDINTEYGFESLTLYLPDRDFSYTEDQLPTIIERKDQIHFEIIFPRESGNLYFYTRNMTKIEALHVKYIFEKHLDAVKTKAFANKYMIDVSLENHINNVNMAIETKEKPIFRLYKDRKFPRLIDLSYLNETIKTSI
jgi:hypothetical protein